MPTPRECVLSVLAGDKPDRVPFIIWDNKLPSPEIERRLLELAAIKEHAAILGAVQACKYAEAKQLIQDHLQRFSRRMSEASRAAARPG